MKKCIALALLFILITSGCSKRLMEQETPMDDWLKTAKLNAEESSEDLYAAALKEDTLVIYSTSTRMMDAAKSFEKQYGGLTVRVEDVREGELYDQLIKNYNTGNFICDVIVSSDGRGIMTNEFLQKGIAVKYVPYDLKDKILPGNNEDLLMLAGEAVVLTYNTLYYSEPPIHNWWELTEEKWLDVVYLPNPAKSVTTLGFLAMFIKNGEIMARTYEDLYGEPLEVPPGENAGQVFIRRLVDNGAVIVNSSDEVYEEIGSPGSHSPAIGIMASSKVRFRDIGYEMAVNYDMGPFCGVYAPISIMIAGGSKNINAAKLYIRWVLGETDGRGEGYKPYLQSGAWSVRNDVSDDTGVRTEELNLLSLDRSYMYENEESVLSFWEGLMKNRQ